MKDMAFDPIRDTQRGTNPPLTAAGFCLFMAGFVLFALLVMFFGG